MKLQTYIKPRLDGTVVLGRPGKSDLVFVAEPGSSDLVCEVDDTELVVLLLKTENFGPALAADFDAAEQMLGAEGQDQPGTVEISSVAPDANEEDGEEDDGEPDIVSPPEDAKTEPETPTSASKRLAARAAAALKGGRGRR